METSIQKWGNSQGVRIARNLLKDANVAVGDVVSITAKANSIIIRKEKPKAKRKNFTLAELVKQIPPGYKPSEYDWGKPMGREVW